MKERLITLVFALAALALFYVLFAPKPPLKDSMLSRPTSAESRENGHLAARRWLESTGVKVVSLRERYKALLRKSEGAESGQGGLGLTPTGNLLIVTVPYLFAPRALELRDLDKWVESGNTLLVMAALGDTPDWSMSPRPPQSLHYELTALADLVVNPHPSPSDDAVDSQQRLAQPERIELLPNGTHPLFAGVQSLLAESEYPASDWFARIPYNGFVLTLARERYSPAEAFWVKEAKAGRVMVSGYASLFTNQLLGEEDNARLLANIVSQSLGKGGAVIFDDMHQGLSELYHPEAFFGDRRLHYTVLLLVMLWLVWVIGGTRLRAAQSLRSVPGERALVQASGGFLARTLRPVDAGRRLLELFFNDLRRHLGEPQNGEPLWDWLSRRPQVAAADVAALRELHRQLELGRRIDLKRLQTLTFRIQEQAL